MKELTIMIICFCILGVLSHNFKNKCHSNGGQVIKAMQLGKDKCLMPENK